MSAAKLKGSLLEFIVRRLLLNCGFRNVDPDGIIIFRKSGLMMINGKGAAHDADVLVTPPIQIPFSYPFRLNFECKAYKKKTDLSVIRNALGLRYDINEFEVVTEKHLAQRKNNNRASLAISSRSRFNYQVGVASIEEFSKPAFEFAANNKIPLLSLRWFLPKETCDLFHQITNDYIVTFSKDDISNLLSYLRGEDNSKGRAIVEKEGSVLNEIYNELEQLEHRVLVGLLESGDMLFLFANTPMARAVILNEVYPLSSRFHYRKESFDCWTLVIDTKPEIEFRFYLPRSIIDIWSKKDFSTQEAINIKENYFSRIFVFTGNTTELPFRVINVDDQWLRNISEINQNSFDTE